MAIKKSELYSTLWKCCDELRGGMDASQYKDYVLAILFVKYISDKSHSDSDFMIDIPDGCYFDDFVALKGQINIGEEINKKMAALIESNLQLSNVFVADFDDDETKLGKGKDKVETLSGLIGIFQSSDLDFSKNRAADDDLIGDAYEYLMKNFATESGKSKGQFYTPAEVSRVIAKVIELDKSQSASTTIYDPQYKDELGNLQTFDFVVANPPFSTKSWLKSAKEEDEYLRWGSAIGVPPEKNGDYAFLLHIKVRLHNEEFTGLLNCFLPNWQQTKKELNEFIV